VKLLEAAEKSVFIYTPNLNAQDAKEEVPKAADRGIEVTVYLSLEFNDDREDAIGQGGNNVKATAELYSKVRQPDKLRVCWFAHQDSSYSVGLWKRSHVKYMSVDDSVAVIGSANWDTQAWYHSQEMNVVVGNPESVQRMTNFLRETTNSEQYCWPHHVAVPLQQARLKAIKPYATWTSSAEACGDVPPTDVMSEDSEGYNYAKFHGFKKRSNSTLPRIGLIFHGGAVGPHQLLWAVAARETLHLDCVWLVRLKKRFESGAKVAPQLGAVRYRFVTSNQPQTPRKESIKHLVRSYPQVNFVPLYGEEVLDGKSAFFEAQHLNLLKDDLLMVGLGGRPSAKGGNAVTRTPFQEKNLNNFIGALHLPVLEAPRAMVSSRNNEEKGELPVEKSRRALGVYHADLMPLRTQTILRALHAFFIAPVERIVLRHTGPEQVPNWMRNAIQLALLPYRSILSVEFTDQQEGQVALRLIHHGSTDLECPTEDKIRTLIYPAFTYGDGAFQKQNITEQELGHHCNNTEVREELPTWVSPDLPRDALRQMRISARGELPQYVFEACLEYGWDKCAPEI